MQLFLLYETASGYAIFEKKEFDEHGGQLTKIQKSLASLEKFSKMVTLEAYHPFNTAEEALENMTAITANQVTKTLADFLKQNLTKSKSSKKQKFMLGICEPKLGNEITTATGFTASYNESISELFRGIRTHFPKLLKKIKEGDLHKS